MSNKYVFDRDSITVNGRTFPARYEVMTLDAARGSFYTVVIFATVDGGEAVRIEVPAADKQHGAALAAAQMAAPLDTEQQTTAAEAAKVEKEHEQSDNAKEEKTMKKHVYNIYFTDHPTQAAAVEAANKREAERLGRQYIREWGLDAKIDRVERVEALEKREGQPRPEYRRDGEQVQPEAAAVCNVTESAPEEPTTAAGHFNAEQAATAQEAPTAAQEAPEEPTPDALEEIGGQTVKPAQAATEAATEADAAHDPKATRGPVPEKPFKNETISGKGWSIVFDVGCNRTRVIIADPVKAAARPIVEAAGFYYSRTLDSWNKKLTFRAFRAANALADRLRAALA